MYFIATVTMQRTNHRKTSARINGHKIHFHIQHDKGGGGTTILMEKTFGFLFLLDQCCFLLALWAIHYI